MSASASLDSAIADGLTITLTDAGKLRLVGKPSAIARWKDSLAAHRDAVTTDDVPPAGVRDRFRRLDVLRTGLPRHVPARRGLCGQDPEGCEARGYAHRAADEIRVCHQSQRRENARSDNPPIGVAACR
jgi:hypothetical protein